jgi:hypothetical protein
MKLILSTPDNLQIALAESRLAAAGIPFEIRNDAVSQAMVGFPFTAELWVLNDEDFEDAQALLKPE